MATAYFHDTATVFSASTDEDAEGPALVAFGARIELREADLVAALFQWHDLGMDPGELDDPAWVRALVAEGLLNVGLVHIADARAELDQVDPDSAEHAWLRVCRRRVREVFTRAASVDAGRRELAGVV